MAKTGAATKSLQLCLTVCDPIDSSPPGSPVPGILRQEHWSGLPFPSPMHESEKWKWSSLSRVQLFVTPWIAAYQAPLSMGFSRQEYWSGGPFPVLQYLPKFAETHVHWVGDAIQPFHPLLPPPPPALNLSQYQGLFQLVASLHHLARVLELQCQSLQ